MSTAPRPQHKILRQLIELGGGQAGDAQQLQSQLRDTYYRRLLPVIDEVCSDLSSPERIHRIDRLEIELGRFAPDEIDSTLTKCFATAFKKQLAAAIGDAPEADADLELFDFFMSSGNLPWWADSAQPDLLEVSLSRLIRNNPQAVRRLLRQTSASSQAWRRIARAYPDKLLDTLTALLAPAVWCGATATTGASVGANWLMLLQGIGLAWGQPAAVRHWFWEHALSAASANDQASTASAPDFYRTILTSVAHRLGRDYPALITALQSSVKAGSTPVIPWVRQMIASLAQALNGDSTDLNRQMAASTPMEASGFSNTIHAELTAILSRLYQLKNDTPPPAELLAGLRAAIKRLPAGPDKNELLALLNTHLAAKISRATRDQLIALAREALSKMPETNANERDSAARSRFSEADALYIGNAGLVVLWPFLGHFFRHLQLLTEAQQFNGEAAMQRAVGLLQYLADANQSPQEFLLPLNKILCGMAPEDVFDFGPEVDVREREECDNLLTAVIQQAPILNNMSIAGFRGSFLLRQGQLSVLDDRWLLRVERQTHDVVLDRFPWGVSTVKLPWMTGILQVEW